ncbi:ArsR/SmtB family transcription factor [Tritonibacter horizontis]|uniref:HTH-type transcriptional regulator CmtR n=1 Tax=Tritonibacter horizontis TaxID=1768241 RepID=A0A132BZ27_9RHOB|nr:metalloregulator ArsR/SmtB family transcription factor [Tritonibacter horizontis]KUP93010.1 HTH-type transcriptional regulator CmtR [Tritonibacter horizontis]
MATPRFDIIGQALSDASRTRMLCELMEGRSFTNKELAGAAGITAQTATAHLRLLQDAGLVVAEKRGRCVFHRLAGPEVAQVLEQLAGIAPTDSLYRAQRHKAKDLAQVRSCYDHLAGPLAVAMTEALLARGHLRQDNGGFVAVAGPVWARLGVALPTATSRKPFVRPCLDWTERRLHLAGPLGTQILTQALAADWLRRPSRGRGLVVTQPGLRAFHDILGLGARLERINVTPPREDA